MYAYTTGQTISAAMKTPISNNGLMCPGVGFDDTFWEGGYLWYKVPTAETVADTLTNVIFFSAVKLFYDFAVALVKISRP